MNPHSETSKAVLTRFKELAGDLQGWQFATEKQGVKLYSQQLDSGPIAVRGDYVAHTHSIHQIMAVASSAGARKICKRTLLLLLHHLIAMLIGDDKFDCYEMKKIYDSSDILFWAKVKTPWPVSPRDMCCIVSRVHEPSTNYFVMASVQDDQVPEISGNVRAHLLISGWKVQETDTGIQVTYITQIDLKGSIPGAFLKNIQIQVPLCAGNVVEYAEKYGYPPFVIQSNHVRFASEDFDHDKKTYTSSLQGVGEGARVEYDISKKMYPQGAHIKLTGDAKYTVEEDKVVLHDIVDSVTVEIS